MDRHALESAIRDYLLQSPNLGRLCPQNGWIDNDTLQFLIERVEPEGTEEACRDVTVAVSFVEVIMEGAGCVADRKERFGNLKLRLDAGGVIQSEMDS